MTTMERRLKALERAEWDRIHALPAREWFTQGYIHVERLPEPERAELEGFLSRLFDDAGHPVPERLTTDERYRVVDLVKMIANRGSATP